jgi:peptidoglycan/LPS O-acetylase OafA/YrhL
MLCALGLIIISSKDIGDYFSLAWLKYVFANLAFLNFLQPTLPGVFNSNNLTAVNGALWTLKIEVMFYLTVPVFVFLFRKLGYFPVLVSSYLLSIAYFEFFSEVAERTGSVFYEQLARQLPGSSHILWQGHFYIIFCLSLNVVLGIF